MKNLSKETLTKAVVFSAGLIIGGLGCFAFNKQKEGKYKYLNNHGPFYFLDEKEGAILRVTGKEIIEVRIKERKVYERELKRYREK